MLLVTISWTTEVAIGCLFLAFCAGLEPPCECQSTGNLTAWCLDPGSCEEIVDPILTYDDEDLIPRFENPAETILSPENPVDSIALEAGFGRRGIPLCDRCPVRRYGHVAFLQPRSGAVGEGYWRLEGSCSETEGPYGRVTRSFSSSIQLRTMLS